MYRPAAFVAQTERTHTHDFTDTERSDAIEFLHVLRGYRNLQLDVGMFDSDENESNTYVLEN